MPLIEFNKLADSFQSTPLETPSTRTLFQFQKVMQTMPSVRQPVFGCGACVAACKNASAMLFTSAKVSQYALLPQGRVEATQRVLNMVAQMDEEGFGNCTNTGACEIECPKGISLENIARLNRELLRAQLKG